MCGIWAKTRMDGWVFALDGVARSKLYDQPPDRRSLDVGSGCMNMKQLKPHRTQILFLHF